jgi:hypothetical protein
VTTPDAKCSNAANDRRNTILVLIGIVTLAIQFWALHKSVKTKIAILRMSAEIISAIAVIAAEHNRPR